MANDKIRFKMLYTKQDNEFFEDRTLELLRKKYTVEHIAYELGISTGKVNEIIKKTEQISGDEINEIRDSRHSEKVDKARQEDPYLKVIINGVTVEAKTYKKLAMEIPYTPQKISRIVDWLLGKGIISQEQMDNAKKMRADREREERERKKKQPNRVLSEEKKRRLIRLFKGGISDITIRNRLDLEVKELAAAKRALDRRNIIKKDEIKERRQVRIAKTEDKICYLYNEKLYSLEQIKKHFKYEATDFITRTFTKLRKAGRINYEAIREAKDQNDEDLKIVYGYIERGMKNAEIMATYEQEYGKEIGITRVRNYRKRYLEQPEVSREELQAKQQERAEEIVKRKKLESREMFDDRICELVRLDFTIEEIAKILNLQTSYYVQAREEILVMQGRISEVKLGQSRFKKREQASVERMTRINKSEEMTDEERTDLINTQITYTRAKIRLCEAIGNDEIRFYVDTVSKSDSEQGLYIANAISMAFVKNGKNFIAKQFLNSCESNCSDSEMKKKLKQGVKEIDEYVAKKRAEKQKASRVKAINKMIENESDVVIPKLLEHIDYVREEAKTGKAKRSDVNIVGQAIVLNGDLVTEENVSLILGEHLKNGRLEEASNFINGCMTIVSDNNRKYAMVYEAKKKLDYEINKKKAEDMIRNGEKSIETIRYMTGIMEIDIIAARRKVDAEKKAAVPKAKNVNVASPGTPVDEGR